MISSVKTIKQDDGFAYLKQKFPRFSDGKIKFDNPKIRKPLNDLVLKKN